AVCVCCESQSPRHSEDSGFGRSRHEARSRSEAANQAARVNPGIRSLKSGFGPNRALDVLKNFGATITSTNNFATVLPVTYTTFFSPQLPAYFKLQRNCCFFEFFLRSCLSSLIKSFI